ncbi:DNRLRE domain-containing protein [Paenibacillus illinoisensis]|uniref:TGF-beta propeptide n=1 Tax=Paenibacillus illinoisensis TaxID=59845 RepID=A0A2W0C797_9BACL|nr:DNRLRE domain-containing protein [Paenibacillus illinoisensis]PYY28390.1 TGF-beta propeptide [Paenibacillus illinoisensis]
MFRIVEQTQAQMQQGVFSSSNIVVDVNGKLTLVNQNIKNNIALNKPYTKTLNAPLSSSDVGDKMFTDGIKTNRFLYNSTADEEIVIDLGNVQAIGGTLFLTGVSTGVQTPHYVEILTSVDNINFISRSTSGNGTNGVHSFTNEFESTYARYVKFKLSRTNSYPISIGEGEVYTGTRQTETREQTYDISPVGRLKTNNVYWIESIPVGTEVIVESCMSLDGGITWSSWQNISNGGPIKNYPLSTDVSSGRLKIRQTLTTTNILAPSISNFNIYIDDTVQVNDSYIVISRSGKSLNPINPAMTSSSTPSPYSVKGTGLNETTYPSYKLFDGVLDATTLTGVWRPNGANSYAQIDLGPDNRQAISGYRLYKYNTLAITGFKISGSNDDNQWMDIDERLGVVWEATETYKDFTLNTDLRANKNDYRYYRFTLLGTAPSAINELQLFSLIDANGYQIKSKITIPNVKGITGRLYIPPHNKATGAVIVTPLSKKVVDSRINIKAPLSLVSRINIPAHNKAQAIVNIVKQPTVTISIPPNKDAFVRESIPKLNYGTEQDLYAGFNTNLNERYRSFMGFDLNTIPPDQIIKQAHLKIYHELSNTPIQKVEIYEVDSNWTERGITWDNQPQPTNKVAEFEVGNAGGYLFVDITKLVEDWYENNNVNNGFVIKLQDESQVYYKRFYSRESRHSPSLVVEYLDKTVYTFEKVDLKNSKLVVRQRNKSDIRSTINVHQTWFNEGLVSRIKVANMGVMDSHLVVVNPYHRGKLIVRRSDKIELTSRITIRNKSEKYVPSRLTVSRDRVFGKLLVRQRQNASLVSKIHVRSSANENINSKIAISRNFVVSRLSIVKSTYLTSRIYVVGNNNKELRGQIVVKRSDNKDLLSLVRVYQKSLLPSTILVKSGYLKSRITIPFRAHTDLSGKIRVRVRSAKDIRCTIRIEDPDGDSWGYVYLL